MGDFCLEGLDLSKALGAVSSPWYPGTAALYLLVKGGFCLRVLVWLGPGVLAPCLLLAWLAGGLVALPPPCCLYMLQAWAVLGTQKLSGLLLEVHPLWSSTLCCCGARARGLSTGSLSLGLGDVFLLFTCVA